MTAFKMIQFFLKWELLHFFNRQKYYFIQQSITFIYIYRIISRIIYVKI